MQIANIRFIYKIECRIAGYRNRERRLTFIDMTTCGYRNDSCRNWFCQLQQPIDVYMLFDKFRYTVGELFKAEIFIERQP